MSQSDDEVMSISKIFIKANHDLMRTVVGFRGKAGDLLFAGINSLPSRRRGHRYVVEHEPHQRIDLLMSNAAQAATFPDYIKAFNLGAHPPDVQQHSAVMDTAYDVLLFSLQPEIEHRVWEHRRGSHKLFAGDEEWRRRFWTREQVRQLEAEYRELDYLGPESWQQAMTEFLSDFSRLRRDCPVVILNAFACHPLHPLSNYHGMTEEGYARLLPSRLLRFNLALEQVSRVAGVHVLDGNAILSRNGTRDTVVAPFRLSAEGYRLLAEELSHVLNSLGR